MIPRLSPPFSIDDAGALLAGLVRGGGVEAFEAAMAAATGKRHAVVFSYARGALLAIIALHGWKNREMVLPGYTCAVMPNVILASGNIPRFVDIDLSDFNMPREACRAAASDGAVLAIPTHMYGFPMDREAGTSEADGPDDLFVLHDCCLAFGAADETGPVWSSGRAALFSFSIGKHVSSVEGGALVTDDLELARELRAFRDRVFSPPGPGRAVRQACFFFAAWLGLREPWYALVHLLATRTPVLNFLTAYYRRDALTLPDNLEERLPECLGRLGARQVGKIEAVVARKRALATRYAEALRGCPGLALPAPKGRPSYSHFPCLVDDREAFTAFMLRRGVHVGREVFDYAVCRFPLFREFAVGEFPNAEAAARKIALVPIHHGLTERQADRVVGALEAWRAAQGGAR